MVKGGCQQFSRGPQGDCIFGFPPPPTPPPGAGSFLRRVKSGRSPDFTRRVGSPFPISGRGVGGWVHSGEYAIALPGAGRTGSRVMDEWCAGKWGLCLTPDLQMT